MLWHPPPCCIPIRADVRVFDFDALAKAQREMRESLFDVVLADPPWQLAGPNPTRGVTIAYQHLTNNP